LDVKILASGSRGNATLIKTKTASVLIDCGISYRQILSRQNIIRKDDFTLDALLITHEHTDHICGINTLLGNHPVKVFLSQGTKNGIDSRCYDKLGKADFQIVREWDKIEINNLVVTPFNISHDANEPLGYILEEDGKKLVYVTDTGYLNSNYFSRLENADMYILESNHDIEMLLESKRTFALKERIYSDLGHLSNEDSAFNFFKLRGEKTKKVVLAHLSEECNSEEKALMTFFDIFNTLESDISELEIIIAKQNFVVETKL